jgi:hypothetical protein
MSLAESLQEPHGSSLPPAAGLLLEARDDVRGDVDGAGVFLDAPRDAIVRGLVHHRWVLRPAPSTPGLHGAPRTGPEASAERREMPRG